MSNLSMIGRRIARYAGLHERSDPTIDAEYYIAVIEMSDRSVFWVGQGAAVNVASWPGDVNEMPTRVLNGGDIIGNLITNVIVRGARTVGGGANGPQLFLVLEGERIAGVVPTQRGAVLHVEAILTSPLVRQYDEIATVDGHPLSIDDIVAT